MRWIETAPDPQIGNFELMHLNDSVVTSLIARWYDEMLTLWSAPTNWPRALAGGCAIKVSLIDDAGGLETAYGAFSPFIQSARLNADGAKVERVPGASVLHLDEATHD